MKNKLRYAIAMLLLAQASVVWSVTVHVAPVSCIDADEVVKTNRSISVMGDIQVRLQSMSTHTDVFSFAPVTAIPLPVPVSVYDAASLCAAEKYDYLLYGYVQKDEYSWKIELKLFDFASRNILQSFYSSDDAENYDRMIDDIGVKVLSYLERSFGLPLSAENKDHGVMSLSVPVGLGYWTCVDNDWISVILGTVVGYSGIEYIPNDRLLFLFGKKSYASVGMILEYRLGVGNPDSYGAFLHSFSVQIPWRFHVELNSLHSLTAGTTLIYAIDALNIEERYSDPAVYASSTFGFGLSLGYRFRLSERTSVFFDNTFDTRFGSKNMMTYSPRIGAIFTTYTKKLEEN